MKKLTSLAAILLFAVVFTVPAHGVVKKTGQTGLQFLKVDMSARSAAMGGAFLMVGDDASAMFHNPAGMAKVSGLDAFGSITQWIADISYNAGGLALNIGNLGTIGVNAIFADYGNIQGTRVARAADTPEQIEAGYVPTDIGNVGALAAGISYARSLTSKFTVGGGVRYVVQSLGENDIITDVGDTTLVKNKVSGYSIDFGTIFYPGLLPSLRVGMSIKNFSPEFEYEKESFQLPLTFVMGVAVDLFDFVGSGGNNSLLLTLDALHPRDYTERIHVGAEYWFANMVALRGGYKSNYDEESWSIGGGLKLSLGGIALKVDYAYSDFGVFNNVNRFTIGASF